MSKIQNPNSFKNRTKKMLLARWSAKDTPTSEPRFQPTLLMKDIFIFVFLPIAAIFCFKLIENSINQPSVKKSVSQKYAKDFKLDGARSQIIEFKRAGGVGTLYRRKSPGTVVKIRLMNVVETFSNAPVHAQVLDSSLGKEWVGATLLGEATGDPGLERINITFNFVKNYDGSRAVALKARALSLNGTLGIEALKKEGFFARSAFSGAESASQNNVNGNNENDIKTFLIRALASGLMQEASNTSTVNKNKSQVLTLKPGEVFFAELTDFFPGAGK